MRDARFMAGVNEAASVLGVTPEDLLTLMSYETGGTLNPTQAGPRTKWGQHRGLIQFGEPQAAQFGVDWNDPVGSQLGAEGAIVKYALASGYKPGSGIMNLYSTINAGGPGRFNARDEAAGGAPGTVREKVEQQMGGHRANAQKFLEANRTDTSNPITDYSISPSEADEATTALRKDTSNPISGYGGGPNGASAVPTPTAKPEQDNRSWLAKMMGRAKKNWRKNGGPFPTDFGTVTPKDMTDDTPMATVMLQGQQGPGFSTVGPDRQQMAEVLARLNSGQLWMGG